MPIKAIIDTGSPTTLIGLADMRRMRLSSIQTRKIEGKRGEVNIGGGKVETIKLMDMGLRIGNYIKTTLDVQFPLRGKDANQPSLLGVDFLKKIKAKFSFDPTRKEAYLEIEDK